MTDHSRMWCPVGCVYRVPRSGLRSVLVLAIVGFVLLFAPRVSADQSPDASQVESHASVVVGINGHYRLGRMTAVKLTESARDELGLTDAMRSQLQLETLDGDGVRTRYGVYPTTSTVQDQPTGTGPDDSRSAERAAAELGYVVPGSEAAPLVIRRLADAAAENDNDLGAELLVRTRFPVAGIPSRGPSLIPPGMPWVVSIGDPLGVDSIGASNVLVDKAARIAVTKIDAADQLPFHDFGYDGVDLVMVNASGLPVLRDMTALQSESLVQWIRGGGRVLVCLGESTIETFEAAPWLSQLFPLDEVIVSRYDPAAFETFTSSQTPLEGFGGVRLPRRVGRSLISGRTTRRVSATLAAQYVVGFGHLTVVAADLDRPAFARWPERLDLVKQVVGDLLADPASERENRNRSTSFGDLAGQMRGVLDQFAIKPRFSFSLLSVIVMLLIAAIGPLDYLLINRVFGKPLLGWLSFPLIAIALSVFLVLQARPKLRTTSTTASPSAASSSLLRANQIQVTDIDLVDGAGRGFAWCSLYSHESSRVQARYWPVEAIAPLQLSDARLPRTQVFPMGFPGRSFGGIQMADENTVFPPYWIIPSASGQGDREGVETRIDQLTIAPRSSKSIAARVSFSVRTDLSTGVTRRPSSELLRGAFVNPLPYDLLDGVLIYGNWVYLLPTRVPAGATVAELNDLRQKNFRWRLTRQQSDEKEVTATTPWSPSDFSDGNRVAELLMFHRAAGGELYTGLRHDVIGDLDLSEALVEDRCILVGRTEKPLFDLEVKRGTDESQDFITPEGSVLSMVRVVMPVRSTRLN